MSMLVTLVLLLTASPAIVQPTLQRFSEASRRSDSLTAADLNRMVLLLRGEDPGVTGERRSAAARQYPAPDGNELIGAQCISLASMHTLLGF